MIFLLFVARVSDRSGALFWEGFFCRAKKSGNVEHDPQFTEGHAQKKRNPSNCLLGFWTLFFKRI
jgi:hypothetical protein